MTRPSQPHAQPKIHEDQRPPLANTKTVEEARKALADHDATCPGDHFQCYGDPAKERARQKWVDDRQPLLSDLELAERTHAATWGSRPIPSMEPTMPTKKTGQEKLATMLIRLDRLIAEGKNRQASCLRSQIRSHCEGHGLAVPALPVNPNPTPGIIQKALKASSQPEATDLEEVLSPRPGEEPKAYAQLERVLGLPEGTVRDAAASANHGPFRESIPMWGQDALRHRAEQMLEDAAALLKQATHSDAEERANAVTALGNLDALVHLVNCFVADGRIEVGA